MNILQQQQKSLHYHAQKVKAQSCRYTTGTGTKSKKKEFFNALQHQNEVTPCYPSETKIQ